MTKVSQTSEYVRKKIESSIAHAEEDRQARLLSRRLELARSGVASYQQGQIAEAVKAFHSYIRLLEEFKSISDGELMPSCFDLKTELPELMVLSGVYWDLIKIYDQAKSADRHKDFLHYMEKYITFSKGLPYQTLSAETLRKYISNRKAIHMADFKNAYAIIGQSKCFVATSLIDVTSSHTLPTLRKLRDERLKRSPSGRWFIRQYYRKSPKLIPHLNRLPDIVRRTIGFGLDWIASISAYLLF